FVRNNLRVLQGGARRAAAPAAASTAAARAEATALAEPALPLFAGTAAVAIASHSHDTRIEQIREARMKGYEGDSCGECGNFTLVRNGTCLKCDTCGSTSGCSWDETARPGAGAPR